jgi:hypothetical protein
MDLDGIANELYGSSRDDFVPARNAYAKQAGSAGDRTLAETVRALPKPSVSAWLVNLLARRRADELRRVLDLGVQMQEAQRDKDGPLLRELAADQTVVLGQAASAALAEAAEEGHRVSETIRERVVQTLRSAMADPEAAGVVASGLLVRDLESAGFGPIDLDGAVAVPSAVSPYSSSVSNTGQPTTSTAADRQPSSITSGVRGRAADARRTRTTKPKPDPQAVKRAQARLDEATRAAEELGIELASVSERVATGKAHIAELRAADQRLRDELADISAELDRSKSELRDANRRHADLERRASQSRFAVRRAQAELDDLTS